MLSNIEYEARIAGDQLLVTAKIEFTQFADGWQILALSLKQLAVERATLDGKPARFVVLAPEDREPTGDDKTSLMFQIRHQPGALALPRTSCTPTAVRHLGAAMGPWAAPCRDVATPLG